jgi:hypothetical protein
MNFGEGGGFHGSDVWDAMVGSWGPVLLWPRGGRGDRRKPGEWGFCNSVHVVLANRFPSCL